MSDGYDRPELLATPQWLAENIARPGFGVLDLRWRPDGSGRRIYSDGHIPSATYLDWHADLVEQEDESNVLLLAGPQKITAVLAKAGIGNGMVGVIYDDTAATYAARAWWTLRVYGMDSTRILSGGLEAWQGIGQPVSDALELRPSATFTPRLQARMRLTAAEIRDLMASPQVQLLDARAAAEFRGFAGSTRRLGHIPGAINVPAAATTEPGSSRFLPAADLRAQLRLAGVDTRRRLICYDSMGVGACKLAFVLALLGYDDVAVYDGGWAEWGDRLDLPAER